LKNIKKYITIGLASIIIISSFSSVKAWANGDNSVISQIEALRNSLNSTIANVKTAANDILGLKNTVSTQQGDITALKGTIAKQEKEIENLSSELSALKSQSGISNELITIKIASFSSTGDPRDNIEYNPGASLMNNRQLSITNISDPQKTYTCTLDENGKGEVKVPAGTYMVDFGTYNIYGYDTNLVYQYVVSPDAVDPKIAIVQTGYGDYTNILPISNIYHLNINLVKGDSMSMMQSGMGEEYNLLNEF
jgi:uncharacterized coiled-coil protein SlyX